MDGLFQIEPFQNFGPCGLTGDDMPPAVCRVHGTGPSQLRRQVGTLCPAKPGVYGMLDGAGELVYVGKAKQLRHRLQSYFRPRSRPPKAGRILRHAKSIVWEISDHEFAALLREQELIRRWRPRWNVQGQPLRRRLAFLCVGRAPGPYAYLTRQPSRDAAAVFGPVTWSQRSVRAVQRLNDCFRLRDCPGPQEIIFPEQGGLFPLARAPGCLRAEVGTCLAPCTGLCQQVDYTDQVQRALEFLSGANVQLLSDLANRMHNAAVSQQFELAASRRDAWNDLTWLSDQLARLRHAQEAMSFIYPVFGWSNMTWWYLIHGARVIDCVPAPCTADDARRAANALARVYARNKSATLLAHYEHHDGRLIVMQWFRQRPREMKKILTPEQAQEVCARLAKKSKSA